MIKSAKNELRRYNISKYIYVDLNKKINTNIHLRKNEYIYIINNHCAKYYFDSYFGSNNAFDINLGNNNSDIDVYIAADSIDRKREIYGTINNMLATESFNINLNPNSNYDKYMDINELDDINYYSTHAYSMQIFDYFSTQIKTLNELLGKIYGDTYLTSYFDVVLDTIIKNNINNTHNINYTKTTVNIDDVVNFFNIYQNLANTLGEYHNQIYNIINNNDIVDIYEKNKYFLLLANIAPVMTLLNKFLPDNRILNTLKLYGTSIANFNKKYIGLTKNYNVQIIDNNMFNYKINNSNYVIGLHYTKQMSRSIKLFFRNVSYNIFNYDFYINNIDTKFSVLSMINIIDNYYSYIYTLLFMMYLKHGKNIIKISKILPILNIDTDNNNYIVNLQNENIISKNVDSEYIINKLYTSNIHFAEIFNLDINPADIECTYLMKFCIVHRLINLNNNYGDSVKKLLNNIKNMIVFMNK